MDRSPEPTLVEEAEQIRRCLAGDPEAFGVLVKAYQKRIHATLLRILGDDGEAEDLAQETFLRAFSKLESFRQGARFSTWLYTIAINLARSALRKRRTRRMEHRVPLEELGDLADPSPDGSPAELAGRRELYELALFELRRLDPESREVVVLRDMQGLSYQEMARVIGCPMGTIRSRLHRARAELAGRLAPRLERQRRRERDLR